MKNRLILGIDTSNYKTSAAVTDMNHNIICDLRKFLKVKQGERGLRQSDALFQHIKNLPELIENISDAVGGGADLGNAAGCFDAVAYSAKPRPAEGSYMPVFLVGESFARSLAAMMGVPALPFSHQEGHIEAIKAFSELKNADRLMACHFSGGTSELLEVTAAAGHTGYDISIIGGSKDIAFGQVIDRAGVMLGMDFPAGEEMDRIATGIDIPGSRAESEGCSGEISCGRADLLTKIKVKDAWLNLSGIDTQVKRIIEKSESGDAGIRNIDRTLLIREIFEKISDAMTDMIIQAAEKNGISDIIMAGGVTSSSFIRKRAFGRLEKAGIRAFFDDRGLAQDNAVGISLLGGREIWG
jgi:N6-L-threonylcarbamoyladenine synthase